MKEFQKFHELINNFKKLWKIYIYDVDLQIYDLNLWLIYTDQASQTSDLKKKLKFKLNFKIRSINWVELARNLYVSS